MAFAVRFYQFAKKRNSTAIPSGSYTEYTCTNKGSLDILHPEIVIKFSDNAEHDISTLVNTNYARIPAFERWYYIRSWRTEGPLWIASMDVDALASWRQTIGAQNIYVYRSASQYDLKVADSLYPATVRLRKLKLGSSSEAFGNKARCVLYRLKKFDSVYCVCGDYRRKYVACSRTAVTCSMLGVNTERLAGFIYVIREISPTLKSRYNYFLRSH